jgi:hypothetical protein
VHDLDAQILKCLYENGGGWGESRGLPPTPIQTALGVRDVELAAAVYRLRNLGLVNYNCDTTTAFNDPIELAGFHLTNVYLTSRGWDQVRQGVAS